MAHHPHALWAEAIPDASGQGPKRMTTKELLAMGDQSHGYELVEGGWYACHREVASMDAWHPNWRRLWNARRKTMSRAMCSPRRPVFW